MDYDYNMDFLSSPHTVEREASRGSQYSRDDIRNYLDSQCDRRDMDVEDDLLSRPPSRAGDVFELDSPRRSHHSDINRTPQRDHTERRPPSPPGPPKDLVPVVPGGSQTLKPQNDPFETVENPNKHKANQVVYTAFVGHSRRYHPSHIKLQEAGWAMAKRVFHPPEAE